MKYLQFNEKGILVLVSKTRVTENDLEVEDSYIYTKKTEVEFNGELIKIPVDKTKEEILEDLFPKLSNQQFLKQDLESQKQNILIQLDNIDLKSIRVMREQNQSKLNILEGEAVLLRNQLKEINLKLDDLKKVLNDT